MMPGLLGSSFNRDVAMFQTLFLRPEFQPDMIKIYPCVVTKDSELYALWKRKKYRPLTNKQTERLICEIKKDIPPYVRITRLIRDIPEESIEAGPNISNLRQLVQAKGIQCNCIRCREVRGTFTAKDAPVLNRINYDACGGKEIYLEYVSSDYRRLYAMLRLRIPDKNSTFAFSALQSAAIIREVHTYGKLVKVQHKDTVSPQHIGLGKKLIIEAERIAKKEYSLNKIAVISGIGVRGYYRKLGYKRVGTYMIKNLATR
jgi:elongator complex protein 3